MLFIKKKYFEQLKLYIVESLLTKLRNNRKIKCCAVIQVRMQI